MADATPVVVQTSAEENFKPDLEKLRKAITSRTKALILNSPNNPSGGVLTKREIEDIARIVKKANIFVISDEIYEKIMYDGNEHFSIGSIKAVRDHVITVNGVSKAYAMTGWRIGYAGGPPAVMDAAAKVQSQSTSNANSIAQKAAIAGLVGSTADVATMVSEFKRRRDFVHNRLASIENVSVTLPGGAFYFFFDVSRFYGKTYRNHHITDSIGMGAYLLEHHHIGCVPGIAFGDDRCLRISYACSMLELRKGMEKIKEGLEALT
jgi:aspartate aminotransferase